ncbi:MAG: long-chain fatty acid--CoA ligase [Gallionellaceae bacterium]|nr:long-chain fatty acid--CoA ligase [Gallionellaceae bacterium]
MNENTHSAITPQQAITLHGLFLERVKRTPDTLAYRYFDTASNAWNSFTWREAQAQVARWQAALLRENLTMGDRVAVMLRNCPQWIFFDQAALSLGLVVVPLYTVDRPDNVAYIVNDAQVKVLLFETQEQWQELSSVRSQMTTVQRFVSLDETNSSELRLQSASKWLSLSAQLQASVPVDSNQLTTIVYTSGTTGKPKGVMLSHANILSNAYACLDTFPVSQQDLFLSFLPLSHAFERTLGYYLTVMTGATVAFARSIALLSEDLQAIKPTVLISVPRIYERIYAAINQKLNEGSPLRKKLFYLAVEVGWARFLYQQGRGSWQFSFLLWPLLNLLVARKLMQRLGGRLRSAVSGGAALAPEISRVFVGLGLPIVQGYGLTETSPVISGNHLNNNFPESVGQVITGVQVRLGEHDALLVKGPNVMMGYWNNSQATQAMIDAEGWLNTGDIARISESGHITITGRVKEIIVMSNGEKLPPADIEMAITRDALFEQVIVLGEARSYMVAVAVVNPIVWQQLAQTLGVRHDMPESLRDTRVEQQALQRIAAQLKEFPGYAKIHRVLLQSEPWTVENGILTPTLKMKRNRVVEHFAEDIAKLYEGH